MPTYFIEVDDKKVRNRLWKIQKGLDTTIPATVFEAAEFGKRVAIKLVPGSNSSTGMTKAGIKGIVAIKTKGVTEARVGFFENPHPEKEWAGGSFNLPEWMTYSKKALVHPWKGGKDPRFLLIAKDLTWEKFKKDVEINTGNLLH